MTATRPTFRSITAPLDVDDATLGRLNEQLGVPALVRSDSKSPSAGQGKADDAPPASPRPSPSSTAPDSPKARKPAIASPGPVERLSLDLPGYLTDAIKRQAFDNRTSVRHVIMRGLAALGFEIAPRDLVPDGRRQARKRKSR
jgi:hypothetical protein